MQIEHVDIEMDFTDDSQTSEDNSIECSQQVAGV